VRAVRITVEFGRAGSSDFARALEAARAHPSFATSGPPLRYRVTFDQDELDAYEALLGLVGRWSSTRVLLEGQPVDRQRLDHLLACYRARLAAADRAAYCQGREVHETRVGAVRQLFPCRMIPINETNHRGWFQYGRLTRDGTFLVDKGQLRQAVRESAARTLAEYCPAYFAAEVDLVIDRLPDRIHPGRDRRWVYREGWQNGRFMPVGVEKRQVGDGEAPPAGSTGWRRGSVVEDGEVAGVGADGRGAGPDAPTAPAGTGRGPRPRAEAARAGAPAGGASPPARASRGAAVGSDPRDVPPVRWSDVGGLAQQVRVVRENLELPLRNPDLFARLGVEPHRGLLLVGPPGTGKTLLAKALANECGANFCLINGPEILSKWHGESEANLRRVFEEARRLEPSVVLIDEIDCIAPDRARITHNHEAVLVSQLLTLLDGLTERGRVVVVATTNRPQLVDPAVRRPGRLDLVLEIGLPDRAGREEILRIHTRRMPLAEDVDVRALAARTEGWAGAHLHALCREAGLECVREVLQKSGNGGFVVPPAAIEGLRVSRAHFERALEAVAPAGASPRPPAPPPAPVP
jgi:hypothetical protein